MEVLRNMVAKKQEYIYAGERETPEGVGGWLSGTPESNKRLKTIIFSEKTQ